MRENTYTFKMDNNVIDPIKLVNYLELKISIRLL